MCLKSKLAINHNIKQKSLIMLYVLYLHIIIQNVLHLHKSKYVNNVNTRPRFIKSKTRIEIGTNKSRKKPVYSVL